MIDELKDINGYIDLYYNESCLDGWFSSKDLRKVADAMDKLAKQPTPEDELNLNLEYVSEQFDDILNRIWGILYPNKTDWDYPGQVYNHILVEINRLTKQCDEYRGDINRYLSRITELTDQCDIFYSRLNMMREEIRNIASDWGSGKTSDKELLDALDFIGKDIK